MNALILSPVEHVESFPLSDNASELWDRIVERFLAISETAIEGTAWPIVLALAAFLLLFLGIYRLGTCCGRAELSVRVMVVLCISKVAA